MHRVTPKLPAGIEMNLDYIPAMEGVVRCMMSKASSVGLKSATRWL
jgi:hypothetical protein